MIFQHLDEECWLCAHYKLRRGNTDFGMAYCRLHKKWFPNQTKTKPGLRKCKRWTHPMAETKDE